MAKVGSWCSDGRQVLSWPLLPTSLEEAEEMSPVVLQTPRGQQDRAEFLSTLPDERLGLLPGPQGESFPRLKMWGSSPGSFLLDSMSDAQLRETPQ